MPVPSCFRVAEANLRPEMKPPWFCSLSVLLCRLLCFKIALDRPKRSVRAETGHVYILYSLLFIQLAFGCRVYQLRPRLILLLCYIAWSCGQWFLHLSFCFCIPRPVCPSLFNSKSRALTGYLLPYYPLICNKTMYRCSTFIQPQAIPFTAVKPYCLWLLYDSHFTSHRGHDGDKAWSAIFKLSTICAFSISLSCALREVLRSDNPCVRPPFVLANESASFRSIRAISSFELVFD